MSSLSARRDFIAEVLPEAGEVLRGYYRCGDLEVVRKGDGSPVTRADREVERLLRTRLAAAYPDEAIFGEEEGITGVRSMEHPGIWVLDPIDGTKNFLCHNPLFGCLLGYGAGEEMTVGGMLLPILGELWLGGQGEASFCNGAVVRCSGQVDHSQARLAATSAEYFSPEQWVAFMRVSAKIGIRQFGGDCTLFAALAGGGLDLVIEAGLKPYDYLPLVPIVIGAGGVMTDWQGAPLGLESSGEVLAAASVELHVWALEQMRC